MKRKTLRDFLFCILVGSLALPCLSEDFPSIHEWRANRNKNTRETIAELVTKLPSDIPSPATLVEELATILEREVHLSGYEWESMERRKMFLDEITTPKDRVALVRVFRNELSSSDTQRRLRAVEVLGHWLVDETSQALLTDIYQHGWYLQTSQRVPLSSMEKQWVSNAASSLGASIDPVFRDALLTDTRQPFDVRINTILSIQAGGIELEGKILEKLLRDDDILISYAAFKGKHGDSPLVVSSAAWQLDRIASQKLSSALHSESLGSLLLRINLLLYYSFREHLDVVKPYAEQIRNSIVKIMMESDEDWRESSYMLLPFICREGDVSIVGEVLRSNQVSIHNGAIKACRKLSQSERFSLHSELLKIVYSESESVINRLLAAKIVAQDRNLPLTGNESLQQLMSILH